MKRQKLLRVLSLLLLGSFLATSMYAQDLSTVTRMGNPSPYPMPTTFGSESVEIRSGHDKLYATVGTRVPDPNTGLSRAYVGIFDDIYSPITSFEIQSVTNPGDHGAGLSVAQGPNDFLFVGHITIDAQGVFTKYLTKVDLTGTVQWTLNLGEGSIRSLVYNTKSGKVVVYGNWRDLRLDCIAIDPATGQVDWNHRLAFNVIGVGQLRVAPGKMTFSAANGDAYFVGDGYLPDTDGFKIVAFKVDKNGLVHWGLTYNRAGGGKGFRGRGISLYTTTQGENLIICGEEPGPSNNNAFTSFLNVLSGSAGNSAEYSTAGLGLFATAMAYNPVSDHFFLAGNSTGAFAQGMLLKVQTSLNAVQLDLYDDGNFFSSADYSFRDIKSGFGTQSTDQLYITGTSTANNPNINPGQWFLRNDAHGNNAELCPDNVAVQTKPLTLVDVGKYESDTPHTPTSARFRGVTIREVQKRPQCGSSIDYFFKADEEASTADEDLRVTAYPNPMSGTDLEFAFPVVEEGGHIQFTDLSGRVVRQQVLLMPGENSKRVQLAELESGVYLATVTIDGVQTVKTIIK